MGPNNFFHVLLCSGHEINGLVVLSDPSMMLWPQTTGLPQMYLPYSITDESLETMSQTEPSFLCVLNHTRQLANTAFQAGRTSADCARHRLPPQGVCACCYLHRSVLTMMFVGLPDILHSLLNDSAQGLPPWKGIP